ncbi:hypothetical protein EVAR_90836_1 [Eumeta japonica]|uniref:Histone-lysine N-methyltransferase SETMAR n=1 Tax=Eumeta variegata TaxID=151549 RepID=A0A4C2AD00_EUMVA|nr:hypothetical protein EVAR_90836_1 [Eumeta japonica]
MLDPRYLAPASPACAHPTTPAANTRWAQSFTFADPIRRFRGRRGGRPAAGAAQMTRPIQTSCTERAAGGISLYSSVLNLPNSVSVRVAQNWFKRFQSSNFDVKDKPCSGLSVTDKADAILEKLEQGHQIRSYDIAEELRIDHRTVLAHLKKAGYTKSSILGSIRAH